VENDVRICECADVQMRKMMCGWENDVQMRKMMCGWENDVRICKCANTHITDMQVVNSSC